MVTFLWPPGGGKPGLHGEHRRSGEAWDLHGGTGLCRGVSKLEALGHSDTRTAPAPPPKKMSATPEQTPQEPLKCRNAPIQPKRPWLELQPNVWAQSLL